MSSVRCAVRRLFNRRLAEALLWALLITLVAVAINLIGIHVLGTVTSWNHWLKNHRGYLLAWRLCLYGATAYGWWRMRQRMVGFGSNAEALRWNRTEIAAVLTVLASEGAAFLQSR